MLSVVLFHVGIGPFNAGYLGVDIFFVISGFLITSLVAAGIERGDFSLTGFYFRRAKRLLPAAYTTVAITVLIAPWCLSRRELHDLAWQAAGAVTFTANVVLWRQTGYFDGAAELKPLLHTWSLSLEEQYYLLLPTALLLLGRRRWLGFAIGALVISLGLCVAGVIVKPVLAFYLLPTRAWELLAGSVGALWLRQRPPGAEGRTEGGVTRLVRALFYPAVVGLLALPMLPLAGPHPGLGAALACAATLVVILRRHPGLARSGPVRGLAAVGDISYSLYLVHWPILALLRNAWGNPAEGLPLGYRAGALLASLAAAWALFRWVEAPIHHARLRASPALVGGLVLASLSLIGVTPLLMRATQGPVDYEALRSAGDGFAPACDYDKAFTPKPECRSRGPAKLLVWGDSFAMHLVPGLAADPGAGGLIQATMNTCGPLLGLAPIKHAEAGQGTLYDITWARRCIAFNDSVLAYLRGSREVQVVVLSSLFTAYTDGDGWRQLSPGDPAGPVQRVSAERSLQALLGTVTAVRAAGKRVVLMAPPPLAAFDAGACVERQLSGLPALGQRAGCEIDLADYRRRRAAVLALLDEAARQGVPVIRFEPWLCGARACQTLLDGTLVYRDYGHLTSAGARLLDQRMHWGRLIDSSAR